MTKLKMQKRGKKFNDVLINLIYHMTFTSNGFNLITEFKIWSINNWMGQTQVY